MNIREYAAQRKQILKELAKNANPRPHLVIIQANNDPASDSYIKGKLADCQEVGFVATHVKLDAAISQQALLEQVNIYNNDQSVHGIIVQMPIGRHIDEMAIKLSVTPSKDVDGFHPLSPYKTCTPKGIIDYLHYLKFPFEGKNALVIGRSNIVGKPLAQMLIDASCNVTIVHSKTKNDDLLFYLAHADLICVAVGKKWFINEQPLKPSACIVDIGINRVDGQLFGDVKPNLAVAMQTPVPGGVGLLTRLSLINNVWEAYNHGI